MESGIPPNAPSGFDILDQLRGTSFRYGKTSNSSSKWVRVDSGNSQANNLQDDVANDSQCIVDLFEDVDNFIEEDIDGEQQLWKKRSIFFDLPYWKHNLLRHNLDVMHIEKNICDNLLGTLLNIDGKSKDNEKAQRDLMEMGIRHDLHLINRQCGSYTGSKSFKWS